MPICVKLGTRAPSIALDQTSVNSTYDPARVTLHVAVLAKRGPVPSFLHQLAHHISIARGWGPWHDADFKEVLTEVVRLWEADSGQRYPWETELVDGLRANGGEDI